MSFVSFIVFSMGGLGVSATPGFNRLPEIKGAPRINEAREINQVPVDSDSSYAVTWKFSELYKDNSWVKLLLFLLYYYY